MIGLPGEEERGLAENLFFLEQDAVLSPQPPEFIVVIAREALGESIVDLCLDDLFAQCVRRDANLIRRGLDSTAPDAEESDRFSRELRCVRQRCFLDISRVHVVDILEPTLQLRQSLIIKILKTREARPRLADRPK